MDNIQFCKSFYFHTCNFKNFRHTDNSGGTQAHHIGWVREGSAVFEVGNERHEFCAGDVFYTPKGCRYHSYWRGEVICYDSYAFDMFPSRHGKEYGVQKLDLTQRAFSALSELSESKAVNSRSVGLLYLLLGEVLPSMTPTERDPKREILSAARCYMRENIDFSVRDLARHLGMSESGLYALFREVGGTTPVAEKNRIRSEKAVELLRTTDKTVEEISEALGFSSAAYFRKVLRAELGKTPRELRRFESL